MSLSPSCQQPPEPSPLRRQRLQTARYLHAIASLQARIDELGNEHAQLEAIIAAQTREIQTLRQALKALPELALASVP